MGAAEETSDVGFFRSAVVGVEALGVVALGVVIFLSMHEQGDIKHHLRVIYYARRVIEDEIQDLECIIRTQHSDYCEVH
jgi:hypothetical protein